MQNRQTFFSKGITFFLMFTFALSVISAPFGVSHITFEDQGETIVIRYDLDGEAGQKYKIKLSLEDENGRNYPLGKNALTGDVGKNVLPGTNKKVTWQMLKDYPSGLEGEGFMFSVEAVPQKKAGKAWLYVVGGAAVAGGAVMLLGGGEEKETKGSVTITVDDSF